MVNNNYCISRLVDRALSRIDAISLTKDTKLNRDIESLLEIAEALAPLIRGEHPDIYTILDYALRGIVMHSGYIDACFYGDLRTSIEFLGILYPSHERKIFISHSSKDEAIIKPFITNILIAGCGLRHNEIFCTLDNSTIHTGEDFRNEIVRGMKECDFIILMISNNYKQSEVCLNEMGAAWALDNKTILPFILPDCSFEDMGFIYKVKQGAAITDKTKLDELYTDIYTSYNIKDDWPHFNQCKEDFIKNIVGTDSIKDPMTKNSKADICLKEKKVLEIISREPSLSLSKLSMTLGLSTQQTRRILSNFSQSGIIRRVGTSQNGYWEIIN